MDLDYNDGTWLSGQADIGYARGDDLWGQSARYRAGEALAKAGLLGDARRVYESLLAITSDPARQSVLRTRLQQLWVLPAHEEDLQ